MGMLFIDCGCADVSMMGGMVVVDVTGTYVDA